MDRVINRRTLRRMIFTIREGRENLLDRDERDMVEEVRQEFEGYLLGHIGWADFSIKWDINPGSIEDEGRWPFIEKPISEWGENIMNLWEWKEWLQEFKEFNEKKYGKKRAKNMVPPPCFTRQQRIGNGS